MVRVKYIGRVSPCRINVCGILFNKWNTEEIRDVSNEVSVLLLKQKDFVLVQDLKKTIKKSSKKKVEEEVKVYSVDVSEADFNTNDYLNKQEIKEYKESE